MTLAVGRVSSWRTRYPLATAIIAFAIVGCI